MGGGERRSEGARARGRLVRPRHPHQPAGQPVKPAPSDSHHTARKSHYFALGIIHLFRERRSAAAGTASPRAALPRSGGDGRGTWRRLTAVHGYVRPRVLIHRDSQIQIQTKRHTHTCAHTDIHTHTHIQSFTYTKIYLHTHTYI